MLIRPLAPGEVFRAQCKRVDDAVVGGDSRDATTTGPFVERTGCAHRDGGGASQGLVIVGPRSTPNSRRRRAKACMQLLYQALRVNNPDEVDPQPLAAVLFREGVTVTWEHQNAVPGWGRVGTSVLAFSPCSGA